MKIRCFEPSDVEEAKRIHELYFRHHFDMPDLIDFLCAFIVEDEKGSIVVGGLKDIPELSIMTNQERSPIDRINGLAIGLDASVFFAKTMGYQRLFAYVTDPKYSRRLQKSFRFVPTGRDELAIDI